MEKPKPGQGQGEEFTAMLNPTAQSKAMSSGDCNGNNCCNLGSELHVMVISIAGITRINGGQVLQEAVQVQ